MRFRFAPEIRIDCLLPWVLRCIAVGWVILFLAMTCRNRVLTRIDRLKSATNTDLVNQMGQRHSFEMQMPGVQRSSASRAPMNSNPRVDSLQSTVLRWTTHDITDSGFFNLQFDDNFLRNEMQDIPTEFPSIPEYLRAFRVPFLEELRAQIHEAFATCITKGDIFPVTVTRMTDRNTDRDPSMRKVVVSRQGGRDIWVGESDLVLLCFGDRPRWDSNRESLTPKTHRRCVLVSVDSAQNASRKFTGIAHVPDGRPILEELRSPPRAQNLFCAFLGMALIQPDRIWRSITRALCEAEVSGKSVLHEVLQIHEQIEPTRTNSLVLPQDRKAVKTLQLAEQYCISRRLNDSQRDVLQGALAVLLSTDAKRHVRLVQGPPGTGKTAMLVPLISVLGCHGIRTLVSAPTNAAVVEVCKRVMSLLATESRKKTNPMVPQQEMFSEFCSRIWGPGSQGGRRFSPVQLCDLVLEGSKEKMGAATSVTSLEKVYLPSRVQRLTKALNPITGWKGCVSSVEGFLSGNAPALFANELGHQSGTSRIANERNRAVWRFAKDYMGRMLADLEEHLMTLTSELPKTLLDDRTSISMKKTLKSMRRTVCAMPRVAPVEAITWLSPTTPDASAERVARASLSANRSSVSRRSKFLEAKQMLLAALASRAGCDIRASKENAPGSQPDYQWLRKTCFQNAKLVFCTVSSSAGHLMTGSSFQCAIVDEASQLVEAESMIVSRKKGLKQLILVGDHKQLPATVKSQVAKESGYQRSLFDRLQTLEHPSRHLLNTQYRMKPEISRFPNSQFYEGGVKDGANVLSQEYGKLLAGASLYGAYAFLNCRLGTEESLHKGMHNPEEVAVVLDLVQRLGIECEEKRIERLSVGIISPYAAQVEVLKQSLGHLHRALDVEVKTVDGFQGNERDVILFTAVRSNSGQCIGFMKDFRRLNVAITRGRYRVWIIGNAATLCRGSEDWENLITDAKARNCFFELEKSDQRTIAVWHSG